MAFFEEIGKHLTHAGQGVAQQTKNLADMAHLNNAISEKEKEVSRLYLLLGRTYYAQHNSDPASEMRETVEAINALLSEITQCQEAIKQMKGVFKCPKCGAEIAANSVFCNSCGTKVARQDEKAPESAPMQTGRICPKCHAMAKEENLFCNYCGAKLDDFGK